MSQDQRPEDAEPVLPTSGPGPDFQDAYAQPGTPAAPTASSPSAQPTPNSHVDEPQPYQQPTGQPHQQPMGQPYQQSYGTPPNPPQQAPYGSGQGYGQPSPYAQPSPSYGQPQPYRPGYGTPSYQYGGYAGAPAEHPRATAVLVLGILGFIFAIPAFIGWYMGRKAKKEIERGAPYRWDGSLKVGYILSIVASVITIAVVGIYVLIFAAFIATYGGM